MLEEAAQYGILATAQ